MSKYYIELQDEPKACGACCIYMILKYHGIHVELKSIKEKSRMDNNGISMKGMLECLKAYQVEAKAYHASLDDIKQNVQLPCILHFVIDDLGHYVVLYEIKDDEYVIGDPNKGLIYMYEDEIAKVYSNMMISILHVGRIPEEQEQSYWKFLLNSFFEFSDEVLSFLFSGLRISIFSFLASLFFQIIIDKLNNQTAYFYMISLSLSFLFVELLKTITQKHQSIHLIELKKVLDEEYVLSSMYNMLDFPLSFFDSEKGLIHSQMLSLYQLSEMNITLFENILLNGITILLFIVVMFFMNCYLTLVVVIMLLIISIYMRRQVDVVECISQRYLEKYSKHHYALLEYIENIFVLRRFKVKSRQNYYHDQYIDEAIAKLEKEKKSIELNSYVSLIIQFFSFVILAMGLWFYHCSIMTMGEFVMFYMLVSSLIPSFLSIVSLFFEYHQMKIVYERYKNYRIEKVEKVKLDETIHEIVLDDVSFAYGYRVPLFSHIDLKIDKTLYIKGNSGSGKSTLLKLLMGYNLNYSGEIFINDIELRNIDLDSLYDHIGYECQTPSFFHMSLYDNFLIDDHQRIMSLLKGFGYLDLANMFHVILNEDGSPLSQGQKQVVALVRLFLRDYDVYIMDEVFANMDNRSAGKIYRYIIKNYSHKILIMVNHQTKLVNRNDDYVIIEKGNLKKG